MIIVLWSAAFGAAAFVCASLVVSGSAGEGWSAVPFAAGIAGFLLAALVRRFFAARGRVPSRRRSAAIGALITFLSHPLTWWLVILHHAVYGGPASLGDAPAGLTDAFSGGLALSVWSLLLTGWWTVPVGAALGTLIARLERGIGSRTAERHAEANVDRQPAVNPMAVTVVLFALGLVLTIVGAYRYPPLHDLPAGFDWTSFIAVFLALLAMHGFLMRERGRTRVFLLAAYCFFIIPTSLGLEVGGKLTLNGLRDPSEPTHHVAHVVDTRGVRSSNGPGEPFKLIQVQSWREGEPDPWIEVHERLYDAVTAGESSVGVVTKRGRFDIEWIIEVHEERD